VTNFIRKKIVVDSAPQCRQRDREHQPSAPEGSVNPNTSTPDLPRHGSAFRRLVTTMVSWSSSDAETDRQLEKLRHEE